MLKKYLYFVFNYVSNKIILKKRYIQEKNRLHTVHLYSFSSPTLVEMNGRIS